MHLRVFLCWLSLAHRLILRTLQFGLASIVAFTNITPTIAEGPIATGPEATIEATVIETGLKKTEQEYVELISKKAINEGVNVRLATSIAFCESTYRQYDDNGSALRGKENSQDVGLFQINEKYHLKKSQELGFDIYTTNGNIDYAMWLLKNEGSKHWNWSKPCWGSRV